MNVFTVQCSECLRVVGISIKDFQKELIFCMKCAKRRVEEIDFERYEEGKKAKLDEKKK